MKHKKVAILSGGGSLGAYCGGTLERVCKVQRKEYDVVMGISTGGLMSPLVVLGAWEELKNAYTTINHYSIFDKIWYKPYPFKSDGRIKVLPALISLIVGDKSISSSNNLRKTIDSVFKEEHYDKIKDLNKNVIIASQNLAENPSELHYFCLNYETFEDFKDWLWCSANVPPFMSLVKKNWKDCEGNFHIGLWCDAGLTELIAIDNVINMRGIDEVDIFINREKPKNKYEGKKNNNLVDVVINVFDAMRYNIELEDLYNKINILTEKGINVNLWWLPTKLTNNSLIFQQDQMLNWWNMGFESAFDKNRMEIFKKKT